MDQNREVGTAYGILLGHPLLNVTLASELDSEANYSRVYKLAKCTELVFYLNVVVAWKKR